MIQTSIGKDIILLLILGQASLIFLSLLICFIRDICNKIKEQLASRGKR